MGSKKQNPSCNTSGESDPIKIDTNAKYGKFKKTDEENFECQRYAANPLSGFLRTIRKIKEKNK